MEQQSFTERRMAAGGNPWRVIGIDYLQLSKGSETIKLQNTQDKSEHTVTISNRENPSNINIIFTLDGKRGIGPLHDAINIVNAVIKI